MSSSGSPKLPPWSVTQLSKCDWASATGESTNVKASAPASRGRALRSKETKAKLKLTPPEPTYRILQSLDCAKIKPPVRLSRG